MKPQKPSSHLWLYGLHACRLALENPHRQVQSILVASDGLIPKILVTEDLKSRYGALVSIVDRRRLEGLLPAQAVHQGVAAHVAPLPPLAITDLEDDPSPNQCVMVLDQVSDPHNVGAILRSCAVFGAKALILTARNAPGETGALAKAASGALEIVPLIRVTNLAHGLKELKDIGFWCAGFTESGKESLGQVNFQGNLQGKIALVMGAEGEGLRRLTGDSCDFTVCLPSACDFTTLNVSNAAAIALYETFRIQHI